MLLSSSSSSLLLLWSWSLSLPLLLLLFFIVVIVVYLLLLLLMVSLLMLYHPSSRDSKHDSFPHGNPRGRCLAATITGRTLGYHGDLRARSQRETAERCLVGGVASKGKQRPHPRGKPVSHFFVLSYFVVSLLCFVYVLFVYFCFCVSMCLCVCVLFRCLVSFVVRPSPIAWFLNRVLVKPLTFLCFRGGYQCSAPRSFPQWS